MRLRARSSEARPSAMSASENTVESAESQTLSGSAVRSRDDESRILKPEATDCGCLPPPEVMMEVDVLAALLRKESDGGMTECSGEALADDEDDERLPEAAAA